MSLAIVGCSGGLKAVFIQGVFNALEAGGLRADAYAGASASAVPAACAAAGLCHVEGIGYTAKLIEIHKTAADLGETMHEFIQYWIPPLRHLNFQPDSPRLFLSTCAVTTPEVAAQTQSDGARRLGRKLLVELGRGQRAWFDDNLRLDLFDSHGCGPTLTPDNLCDVMYASLRMLHFAKRPAWVEGQPYIDTSYLCTCPAQEVMAHGYDRVIVIATETGPLYRDLFREAPLCDSRIHVIQPEIDLETLGVGLTDCTDEGSVAGFHYGEKMARQFLETWEG